jgi:hypothetical protein
MEAMRQEYHDIEKYMVQLPGSIDLLLTVVVMSGYYL